MPPIPTRVPAPGRLAVLMAAVVLVVVAGYAVVTRTSRGSGASSGTDRSTGARSATVTGSPVAAVTQTSTATEPGAGGGHADESAAVAAAVRYAASTGELVTHSPIGRREILRRLVTPETVDGELQALNETTARLEKDRKASTLALTWVEAPLTATVLEVVDTGRVRVAVWTLSVLAGPTSSTAEQLWRTLEITVTVRAGRWLVAEVRSRSGPTPSGNPLALPTPVTDFTTAAGWGRLVSGESLR